MDWFFNSKKAEKVIVKNELSQLLQPLIDEYTMLRIKLDENQNGKWDTEIMMDLYTKFDKKGEEILETILEYNTPLIKNKVTNENPRPATLT